MNGKKMTGLLLVTWGLVAWFATAAAAQTAPTLTVTANGSQVTIDWNNIPGALGYQLEAGTTPGGSQIATVQVPASIARPIPVTVPPGTYYLRVRGLAVGIIGPPSNEVPLVIGGGGGCSALTAPTLASSVNGPAATFAWNTVAGATQQQLRFGTEPGRTDLAQQLSSTVNSFTQNVPFTGTFYARVVAANACGQTVTSNEVAFTIATLCGTQNPVLTASVTGATVTFNWTGVAAPTGLTLELSRFNGQTEFTEAIPNPSSGSYQRYIPMLATLYARLVAHTPCGATASAYIPFTITNLNLGSGPRTPDPPPGQLLPMPSYAHGVVIDVANRFPGDLAAHSGPGCKTQNTWLFRLVRELRRRDSRWGLNWKRGHVGSELSTDIVTYNPTSGPDITAQQIYLADVLGAECEGNFPGFNWEAVTDATWNADRLNPGACANRWCAAWTIEPFLAAGFTPDEKER